MDIEDVRVGLISFNSNVSLNSLQIQMAEGYK